MHEREPIAIVGIGGVFPGAQSLAEFWQNILAAKDCASEPPAGRWVLPLEDVYAPAPPALDKVYSKRACFVEGIALHLEGLDIDPALVNALDPLFHLLLHAGHGAWRDGVVDPLDKSRVGVIVGNIVLPTTSSSKITDELLLPVFESQILNRKNTHSHTHRLNRHVTGLPAGILARALGLGGGSYTLDAACAASLYALKYAVDELRSGRADAMLCGGVSRPDSLYTQMGFSALHALSASGRCSPFDKKSDGLVVGEGAGMLLLKRLPEALEHGDHIYATIAGIGLSNDIAGNLMSPASEGQLRAMRHAYGVAGWRPADVDLIECHGTGTPVGDAVEFNSLSALWGEDRNPGDCIIGSVKSNIGHLLTAAGSAGLIKTLLAMQAGVLPPTANFASAATSIDLKKSPFNVLSEARAWRRRDGRTPRRAAVSAFGFGGINAHLLLEEWLTAKPRPALQPSVSLNRPQTEDIAVVGMDACFGPWGSLDAFRKRIFGDDANRTPEQRHSGWGADHAVEAWSLDAVSVPVGRFRIPPNEMEEMLPQQLLMLQVAANAIDDAGLDSEHADLFLHAGVFIGVGLDLNTTRFHLRWDVLNRAREWADKSGYELTETELTQWVLQLRDACSPPLTANRTMGALGGIVASRIARAFKVGGPAFTLSNEEGSGLRALAMGVKALQRGDIDMAIVGAVDLAADSHAALSQLEGRQRAQEALPGEGAGAVVLKRHSDALKDGGRVYAVIKGVGAASEAPSDKARILAMERCVVDAGVDLTSVGYVETHASQMTMEDGMGSAALAQIHNMANADGGQNQTPPALRSTETDIGYVGAVGGLAAFIKAGLCLHHQLLPGGRGEQSAMGRDEPSHRLNHQPRYWLHDRSAGMRSAMVSRVSMDGNCLSLLMQEAGPDQSDPETVFLSLPRQLFSIRADSKEGLLEKLHRLNTFSTQYDDFRDGAMAWWEQHTTEGPLSIAMLCRDKPHLAELTSRACVVVQEDKAIADGDLFYNPAPLGDKGKLAYVFPGSGNHFQGMGLESARYFPHVLNRLHSENADLRAQFADGKFWDPADRELTHEDMIFGQVWVGAMISDVISSFGVKADAVIGYSLGETAGLFATRAWTGRDRMLKRMRQTTLFTQQLAGPCDAARQVWGMTAEDEVDWCTGVVNRSASEVQFALTGRSRVYLLIVNTPEECVIGGDREAVAQLVGALDCYFHPLDGITTVHNEVVMSVAREYRDLHLFDTTPPPGLRFYSGLWGKAYELTADSAADAILGQALQHFDYTKLINQAYEDGVRLFIEMGPGMSCTRMIERILGDREHVATAICINGQSEVENIQKALALLISEGREVDLSGLYGRAKPVDRYKDEQHISVPVRSAPLVVPLPGKRRRAVRAGSEQGVKEDSQQGPSAETIPDPGLVKQSQAMGRIIEQMMLTETAHAQAQAAFLDVSHGIHESISEAASWQIALMRRSPVKVSEASDVEPVELHGIKNEATSIAFDRNACMEFARGGIGKVLGPAFAEVDGFPARVRLPDEPLMLVDRILRIDGQARSMSPGRVVTEHDVSPGAWYLDGGRIPTCIAVEAGQADLFLAAYLGVDLKTRGLAVYRLLDAEVTFHGPLPGAGKTIRYDIHIEHFFRQGDTWLFRFHFDGTVEGKPLITMRHGCAGFFTQAELDAGQGIVLTTLEKQPLTGRKTANVVTPLTPQRASYGDKQLAALRAGDLRGCFGEPFAHLDLKNPVGLPGGPMTLVHRILDLHPQGGRYGIGMITGEMDVHPDDWFLTCHFVDDQVMPGTLMYECSLHTLRVYLLRIGWVGDVDEMVYEPLPGVTGKLKCRGQVIHSTEKVQYEITLKELGYLDDGVPYVIADALMYADGKAIVQMTDMSLCLSGLTKQRIERIWGRADSRKAHAPLFDYQSIHAFAVGRPSDAFGEKYRVFDEERVIARLPGPPYQFLDRITSIADCRPWELAAGGVIEAQYDVPKDAWYFAESRQRYMPYAVLLEVALQPCGWLAAYLGSALTSDVDLSFRNLGGTATQRFSVTADAGTLTTKIKLTDVATSAGMIIQNYDMAVFSSKGEVFAGDTYFGFFSKSALANQIGLQDVTPYTPTAEESAATSAFDYPHCPPYPSRMMRMLDQIACYAPTGGPHGLGYISGIAHVDPKAWFFKAHFFQDPVWPGSLGLESFIQLLKFIACDRWGRGENAQAIEFESMAPGHTHSWVYRGQITPADKTVTIEAVISGRDDEEMRLRADGFLTVDGRIIYQMNDFTLRMMLP